MLADHRTSIIFPISHAVEPQLVVDNWRTAPEGSGIDFLWTGRTEFPVTTLPQRSLAPTGTPPPHDHHEGGEGSDSPGSGLNVEFGEGSGESASAPPSRFDASSSSDRSRSSFWPWQGIYPAFHHL